MYSCVESQTETFQERRSTLLHQNPIPRAHTANIPSTKRKIKRAHSEHKLHLLLIESLEGFRRSQIAILIFRKRDMTEFSLCSFELCRVTGYGCRKLRPFLNFFEQNIVIPSNLTGRCVSSFWMSLFLFPSDMMHRVTRCPTFCFLIPILFCFIAS